MSALGAHITQTISSIPSTLNPPSTFYAPKTSNNLKTSRTQVLVVLIFYPLWGLNPHLLLGLDRSGCKKYRMEAS